MKDNVINTICPECHQPISIDIDNALTSQIESRLSKEFEEKEKNMKESLKRENQANLSKQEDELRKQIKESVERDSGAEKKFLEEQLKETKTKLETAKHNELELRKGNQKLKDDQDAFELDKARQMDEERKKIEENASKKATDAKQAEIDQLSKNLLNTQKALDEAQRKAAQGSQQTQGEVQEIALEELLKSEFIYDDITPVPKGVNGADVIQTVRTKNGVECGKIIWESKKTKSWTEGWIQKLKDDQRLVKADIAVIVSSVLPQGADGISLRNGVWVCDIKLAISIATALRNTLEVVSREKTMSVGKNEKMEILYSYLTGTEFKQRIETIVEAFSSMNSSLVKEKLAYEKIWSEREQQIQKVVKNTIGIYGDFSGIVQLQRIEALELPEPSEDNETKK
ncbi:MAG: DUF2130 domain-containing protein [bacterium]